MAEGSIAEKTMPSKTTITDHDIQMAAVRYQFIYSLVTLVLGLVSMVGGVILFLRGVTGSTNWTAKVLGMETHISDAAPGAILFIVGLLVIFVTRFKVRTRHTLPANSIGE